MPNLYDWKPVKVPVTLHLTDEAAKILYDYAGERSRGEFLSALLVAKRREDDLQAEFGELAAAQAQVRVLTRALEAAQRAVPIGGPDRTAAPPAASRKKQR